MDKKNFKLDYLCDKNFESPWESAVQYRYRDMAKRLRFIQPDSSTVYDHILRRINHISLNTVDKYNIEMLSNAYVYKEETGIIDKHYINRNPESSENFIDTVINSIKATNSISSQPDRSGMANAATGRHIFIIHQTRGSGKTFFLNHIFARQIG